MLSERECEHNVFIKPECQGNAIGIGEEDVKEIGQLAGCGRFSDKYPTLCREELDKPVYDGTDTQNYARALRCLVKGVIQHARDDPEGPDLDGLKCGEFNIPDAL